MSHQTQVPELRSLRKTVARQPKPYLKNNFSKFTGHFPCENRCGEKNNCKLAIMQVLDIDRWVVFPTRVGGETLTMKEATELAQKNGWDKYPHFADMTDANNWATLHNNCVCEDGCVEPYCYGIDEESYENLALYHPDAVLPEDHPLYVPPPEKDDPTNEGHTHTHA